MNRKILFGLAVLAIAVLATFNVTVSSKGDGLSDLSLANVEALARNENNGSCKWRSERMTGGYLAICDSKGVGYDCTCGDEKWYPD